MPKRVRIFLETSAVIYLRHGHSLMKEEVEAAIGDGYVEVSNFIRMEYVRGFIVNLIELYFLIKESESVNDALIDWSQKVAQERKLKIVLMTISNWLVAHEDSQHKEKSLRRLGDLIVRMASEFDERFPGRAKDHLKCLLGRVRFPEQTFAEDMLLVFYERFKLIQSSIPACELCRFKLKRVSRLVKKGIDLYSPAQRANYKKNSGYVKQAERLEKAMASTETHPSCKWCEKLGDSVIVLQAPPGAVLVTADKAFEAFGTILTRNVRLLPSLAALKKRATSSGI